MPLSPRRQLFVEQYLIDRNGAAAAVRAGYAASSARQTAHRLLTNHDIQDAIEVGTVAVAEVAELDAEWVLTLLRNIADNPAARDADRIAATREIGKLLGLYVDRSVSISAFVRPELQGKSIEELKALEAALWPRRAKPAIDGEARVLDWGAV